MTARPLTEKPRAISNASRPLALASSAILLTVAHFGGFGGRMGLTPEAERAFAILLVAALLWISEAVPLFVTSFVVLFLELVWLAPSLASAGVQGASGKFLAPFFSDVVLLFLGGFVISGALGAFELDARLARGVLARTGRKPVAVLFGMMAATAFLSMWMSNTATTAMMLALGVSLIRHVPERDAYRKALLLGIPFAANLGGLMTPVGSPPNAIAIRYMGATGAAPSFAYWMALTAPIVIALLAATGWFLTRKFRTSLSEIDIPVRANPPLSGRAKVVLSVSLLTALGWLTADLHGLSPGSVALVPVVVLFGAGILAIPDLRALPWDVLVIVGGGLSLGVAVEESGLSRWFVSHVPAGEAGLVVVLPVFCVLAAVMSAFMSNTAAANLLMPIVVGIEGVPSLPIVLAVACACSVSMPLPVSTPPNAMVFSSGHVSVRDMFVPGMFATVIGVLLTVSAGAYFWHLLGLF
jgi:sodium-dependent dicarboxylate transporter 2/3/5